MTNDLSDYLSVSVSGDGRTIAADQHNLTSNLWLARSTTPESGRSISFGRLDGMNGVVFVTDNRMVYTANHSGSWELFAIDADGKNLLQLTFEGHFHGTPAACDAGHSVVYFSDFDGADHLWKLDLATGGSTKLTNGPGENGPRCATAGDWVFYRGQTADATTHIFKGPIVGGNPVQLSDRIAVSPPYVSPEERFVGFAGLRKDRTVGGIALASESGAEIGELDIPATIDPNTRSGCWSLATIRSPFQTFGTGLRISGQFQW
jgi:Tol biopolymer transport system component